MLTPDLGQKYGFMDNGTHFSLVVPFSAPDVVFEVQSESVSLAEDVNMQESVSSITVKIMALHDIFNSCILSGY